MDKNMKFNKYNTIEMHTINTKYYEICSKIYLGHYSCNNRRKLENQ